MEAKSEFDNRALVTIGWRDSTKGEFKSLMLAQTECFKGALELKINRRQFRKQILFLLSILVSCSLKVS